MPIPDLLKNLLTSPGPSGHETAPAQAWRAAAETFAVVERDVMGSSAAHINGTDKNAPQVAIVGHIDEIGLSITNIDDEGFLHIKQIGGVDPETVVSQRVEVLARNGSIFGVIGKKAPHLTKKDDSDGPIKMDALQIDIGAKDGDEARSLVRVGDVAVIAGVPLELPNGRAVSRSMDNRLGAYIALEALRRIHKNGRTVWNVSAFAPTQEETHYFGGSRTQTYAHKPAVALVVDVTHATDTPGIDTNQLGKHQLGSGAVIERGAPHHPCIADQLCDLAAQQKIPYTIEAVAGMAGTDADAIHASHSGVATGGISIPLRYMHSPVEMVQMSDVEACIDLAVAFVETLTADATFER